MNDKSALVTGVTGQDGSYLVELLLDKGYEVYGMVRRSSVMTRTRLDELWKQRTQVDATRFHFEYGDMADGLSMRRLLSRVQPDEVYNLAAQSHVRISFEQPEYTADVTGTGGLRLLEALRDYMESSGKQPRFYQASSSEMFGSTPPPQNEQTPFHPRSPYGVAKLFAHWITVNYRESYDIFGVSGILFNHESPLRGREFVTRKITDGIAKIKLGKLDVLSLGNLGAKRDWGYAKDYVEGMWRMMQTDAPDTFVLATGRTQTVRDFAHMACNAAGIDIQWRGAGQEESAVDTATGKTIIRVNPAFYRPAEVD